MVLPRADAQGERPLVSTKNTSIILEMQAFGLPYSVVLTVLSARRKTVRPWLGDGLGTPRDYFWPKGADELWFTPVGVRNLAALLGREIVVVTKEGRL